MFFPGNYNKPFVLIGDNISFFSLNIRDTYDSFKMHAYFILYFNIIYKIK